MELKDLQKSLIDIGIEQKLVEMPSFMERAKISLADCNNTDDIKNHITKTEDGKLIIGEIDSETSFIVELDVNDGSLSILYPNLCGFPGLSSAYDPTITVNQEYGVDQELCSSEPFGNSIQTITRIFNGSLSSHTDSVGPGSQLLKSTVSLPDNGSACLSNKFGEANFKTYEENKAYFTKFYPKTKGFFDILDKSRKTQIREIGD